MMLWDNDTIGMVSAVAEVFLAVVSIVLAIQATQNAKRSEEARRQEFQEAEASRQAAERVDAKVEDYLAMIKHPGARGLSVLGELILEELGSDESIRTVIERIGRLSRTDPWEGKSALVEKVSLFRLFTYVTDHKLDLATADLPSVVQRVKNLGGDRHPVQLYMRRSKKQRGYAFLAALVLLALLLVHHNLLWREHDPVQQKDPVTSDSPGTHGRDRAMTHTEEVDSSGQREGEQPGGDSAVAPPDQDWAGTVLAEVGRTRGLMHSMDTTAASGEYTQAVGTLREARVRMSDLQSRSRDGSPKELVDVIDALDQQIAAIMHKCEEERRWAETWKQPVPTCP